MIEKHFPQATSIEKIGYDGYEFEIYRVMLPDEDDPDFENEIWVVYQKETGKIIKKLGVLRSTSDPEIYEMGE